MEKYRQFEDASKGVNPFIPWWVHYPTKRGLVMKILFFLLHLIPATLKITIFTIGFLLLLLSHVIISIVPVNFLKNILSKLLLPIGCRLCLLGLGFHWISDIEADPRRLKILAKGTDLPPNSKNSNLVFSNFQSSIDVLYFGLRGFNRFVFCHSSAEKTKNKPVLMKPMSLIPALFAASEIPLADSKFINEASSGIQDASSLIELPTVVFGEGCPSVGFIYKFTTPKKLKTGFRLVNINYTTRVGSYTVHQTVTNSFFWHVFYIMGCTFHQGIAPRWLGSDLVTKNFKPADDDTEADAEIIGRWISSMNVPLMTQVKSTPADHHNFFKYWLEVQRGEKYAGMGGNKK